MRKFDGFEKGINLGGWLSQSSLEKDHLNNFITENDIYRIASMGVDHIRLPVDYMLIETADGKTIESGYDYIDRCVKWCKNNKLNIILDLHNTAGYSFNDADNCRSFFKNELLQKRFLSLWDKLSERYGKYSFIAFDLLNEIVDSSVNEEWNALAAQAIKRIRQHTQTAWILIGGTCYNSINTVKNIIPPPDERIVYSFHFYEPYIFTHQGAYWEKTMPKDFRISYPLTAEEYMDISKSKLNNKFSGIFKNMNSSTTGVDMLSSLFEEAIAVAECRNIPLYCGEYGVINLADAKSALAWHKDINAVFEKYDISRALWSYKDMYFGLTDTHYKDVIDELIALL